MDNNQEHFLTKQGLEKLTNELDNLKKVVRPEVITQIKEARAQGDLSENAEYHAARDRQGQVEARIKELEYLIDNATIIEDKKSNTINKFEKMIEHEIPFLNYVPKIYISAVTHQRLNNIFTRVEEVYNFMPTI